MSLPDLIRLNDYNGDWARYEDAIYDVFENDIKRHDLRFRGVKVNTRRAPEYEQKWFTFWHLISEGSVEAERLPDLRRCERLRWVRWIIENGDAETEIEIWENRRKSEQNVLLWFREEYLVVLSARGANYLLKTAYCTDRTHRVQKLRRERDAAT
ncbi:MAG: hypothetical protein MRY72_14160 [Aquisalinus sp.]|nr:hypothetical protein [Aquisalinus sp.]